MRQAITAAVVASLVSGVAHAAPAEEDPVVLITRTQPPQQVPREADAQKPRKGHTWSPGFWLWNGVEHKWVPGEWVKERNGMRWQPPRWQHEGERWQFSAGHWTRN